MIPQGRGKKSLNYVTNGLCFPKKMSSCYFILHGEILLISKKLCSIVTSSFKSFLKIIHIHNLQIIIIYLLYDICVYCVISHFCTYCTVWCIYSCLAHCVHLNSKDSTGFISISLNLEKMCSARQVLNRCLSINTWINL